jgi:hypothetical protein
MHDDHITPCGKLEGDDCPGSKDKSRFFRGERKDNDKLICEECGIHFDIYTSPEGKYEIVRFKITGYEPDGRLQVVRFKVIGYETEQDG